MSVAAMLREVRSIRVELGVGKVGGRYVVVHAAEPNWPDHQRYVGLPPESDSVPWHLPHATISYLTVPSEFKDDPVRGLSPEQRAWLRTGDIIDVDVHVTWPDPWSGTAGITNYEFIWPDDTGPPKAPEWSKSDESAREETREVGS